MAVEVSRPLLRFTGPSLPIGYNSSAMHVTPGRRALAMLLVATAVNAAGSVAQAQTPPVPAAGQMPPVGPPPSVAPPPAALDQAGNRVRVYLDCGDSGCFEDYLREQIT